MKIPLILSINIIILLLLFSVKTVQAIEFNEDCHRKNISQLTTEQQAEFLFKCSRTQQLHAFEFMLKVTQRKMDERARHLDSVRQEIQELLKRYKELQKAEHQTP